MNTPELDVESTVDVLDFEAHWEGRGGAKNSAIRERFNVHPARYYQKLTAHLQTREALEHDAALTYRLLDLHARRRATRASRTFRR